MMEYNEFSKKEEYAKKQIFEIKGYGNQQSDDTGSDRQTDYLRAMMKYEHVMAEQEGAAQKNREEKPKEVRDLAAEKVRYSQKELLERKKAMWEKVLNNGYTDADVVELTEKEKDILERYFGSDVYWEYRLHFDDKGNGQPS